MFRFGADQGEMFCERSKRDIFHRCFAGVAHAFVEFTDSESLCLFAGFWKTEKLEEQGFLQRTAVEGGVATGDQRFFVRREPVTFALSELRFELCIELLVTYMQFYYAPFEFHREEAAAARRVGQDITVVRRSDERSQAVQIAISAVI